MKKVKSIISYIGKCKTISGKFLLSCFILKTLIHLPSFIFHEITHMIIIGLSGTPFIIKKVVFYTITETKMKIFEFEIEHYSNNKKLTILISLSPLIGWLCMIPILILNHNWIILLYFILYFETFYLSKQDIITMEKNGFNQKICSFFYKIINLYKSKTYHFN